MRGASRQIGRRAVLRQRTTRTSARRVTAAPSRPSRADHCVQRLAQTPFNLLCAYPRQEKGRASRAVQNVLAIGNGSPIPVASIRRWSNRPSLTRR
jgi:hypothetical protein